MAGFRRRLRRRLAEAQNWRCAWCYTPLEPETATVDHIKPLARGGPDNWLNTVAACEPCNARRGRKTTRRLLKAHRRRRGAVVARAAA